MFARARINKDKMYPVVNFDIQEFKSNLQLTLLSIDLQQVCADFKKIDTLEIFVGQDVVGTFTSLDSYSEITYFDSVYDKDNDRFVSAIRITLTKTDIAEQVQRLDAQVNPVVDVDSLTLEELRTYKLKQISEECQNDVYKGEMISLSDGTAYNFSYNAQDQTNWDELMVLAMISPAMNAFPYHGNGDTCRFFTRQDVLTICSTLLLRKTRIITYCNQLNLFVNTISDKEELKNVTYGMELPESYTEVVNTIISETIQQLENFMDNIPKNE